jgi:hypothetical protein
MLKTKAVVVILPQSEIIQIPWKWWTEHLKLELVLEFIKRNVEIHLIEHKEDHTSINISSYPYIVSKPRRPWPEYSNTLLQLLIIQTSVELW